MPLNINIIKNKEEECNYMLNDQFFKFEKAFRDNFKNIAFQTDIFKGLNIDKFKSDIYNLQALNGLEKFGEQFKLQNNILSDSILKSFKNNFNLFSLNLNILEAFKGPQTGFDSIFSNSLRESLALSNSLGNFKSSVSFVEPEDINDGDQLENDIPEPDTSKIIKLSKQIIGIGIDIVSFFAKDPRKLFTLKSREFEELIAEIFIKFNFDVTLTQETRDGGYDIIAIDKTIPNVRNKYLIECKRYSEENKVGVRVVRSLAGILDTEKANRGLIITTSSFTQPAENFAASIDWKIGLHDYIHIRQWLEKIYCQK